LFKKSETKAYEIVTGKNHANQVHPQFLTEILIFHSHGISSEFWFKSPGCGCAARIGIRGSVTDKT